jgi:hypothetical protein
MKMLALVALFAAVTVQAEQIKMPSIEELKSRLKTVRYISPDIICRVLSDSEFFKDIAGKKIDSNSLAVKIRRIALALVVSHGQGNECFESSFENDRDFYKAQHLRNEEINRRLAGYLSEKIIDYNRDGLLFEKYVEEADKFKLYHALIEELYKVFFKDYPKSLEGLSRN